MTWLQRDGERLASIRIAGGFAERARGVLGEDRGGPVSGVLLLRALSVHTIGLRHPIDVACCRRVVPGHAVGASGELVLQVAELLTLAPRRITRPRWRDRLVLEAAAGSFVRWGVGRGDLLRVA